MDKQIYILLFLLSASLQLINAKVITTNDLYDALTQAGIGDTIELKSGVYRNGSYTLKSDITIKPAPNAEVIFIGTPNKCIFEGEFIQYVEFYGPMVLKDALCGFKLINTHGIKIVNISIYNMRQQAILMSGRLITISKNRIQGCVLENKEDARRKTSGWNQCVAILGLSDDHFTIDVNISENNISSSYGESIYLSKCLDCYVYKNEITNGLSANIYIVSSQSIEICKNIIRVNSTEYNNFYGKACGIAMSPYKNYQVRFILIQNNIIIGTRIGIYFFDDDNGSAYNSIHILFNTLWNIDYTPILFKKHEDQDFAYFEMKNNFIYFNGAVEFESKSLGGIYSNYFYNTPVVPSFYSNPDDHDSKAVKNIPLDSIFNKISGCENYYEPNLDPKCLRPSLKPSIMKLLHSGIGIDNKRFNNDDFYSCNRSITNPSIGAFEYPVGCSEDEEPTDCPHNSYDVRFNITFCTTGYRVIKIIGSYCNWNTAESITMTKNENCLWTTTFKDGTNLYFQYKFVETIQSSIYKMESDPYRTFDGEYLWKLVNDNPTGIYENCKYSTSGNLITLVCSWR